MPVSLNFARRPFRDYRPVHATILAAGALGLLLFVLNVRDFYAFRKATAGRVQEIQRARHAAELSDTLAEREHARLVALPLRSIQSESQQINALVQERKFSWTTLLGHLERVLPGEVFLTRLSPKINPDGTATIDLDCVGKSGESIVRTIAALEKSPYFSGALPHSETDPEKGSPEGFRFIVSTHYDPGAAP
jgi:Tfp pilus assembly protein PilN